MSNAANHLFMAMLEKANENKIFPIPNDVCICMSYTGDLIFAATGVKQNPDGGYDIYDLSDTQLRFFVHMASMGAASVSGPIRNVCSGNVVR